MGDLRQVIIPLPPGIECAICGNKSAIEVEVLREGPFFPNYDYKHSWNDASKCTCPDCGAKAQLRDWRFESLDPKGAEPC